MKKRIYRILAVLTATQGDGPFVLTTISLL